MLGLVVGTCVGYLVQADREPTPLASLSQPTLRQEKGEGPEPLSAARDRRVKTDGDLRKLLLKKPRGARDDALPAGWRGIAESADEYKQPKKAFGGLVDSEFRRAAATGWKTGGTTNVEVRLLQFRQEEARGAADWTDGGQYWAENGRNSNSTDSYAIPGTADGMAYVRRAPVTKAGYLPLYTAEAHAWRGDIAMDISVYGSKPIARKTILDLATRQMERL